MTDIVAAGREPGPPEPNTSTAAGAGPSHPRPSVERSSGSIAITGSTYRLQLDRGQPYARLSDADGEPWLDLFLGAALDTTDEADETLRLAEARVLEAGEGDARPAVRIEVERSSTAWRRSRLVVDCRADEILLHAEVAGRGLLTDVVLLGGVLLHGPRGVSGRFRSAVHARSAWTPEPATGEGCVRVASSSLALDILGSSQPGMRHWFMTPPPLSLAFSRSQPAAGAWAIPPGPWLLVGLLAAPAEMPFTGLHYEAASDGGHLRLAYEGHTRVDGTFATPRVVLRPGIPDPYEGVAWYASGLREAGLAPALPSTPPPPWWLRPMFCGWGVQAQLALRSGRAIRDECRQEAYDEALAALEAEGLSSGTVVIDDKWQRAFGTGEVDDARWPDLGGWIGARHEKGRRVLLWWKAWDPEGLDPSLCIVDREGSPVAADPANPDYEALLRATVRRLLGPDGLDADGLKIDFTGSAPSGRALRHADGPWGIALLHRLLAILHDEAVLTKPDALIITHAPHPGFADVAGMLRLNDVDPFEPVVPQMLHRARVAEAACAGVPIDTDDWPMVDRAAWREYLGMKGVLGVPALYVATSVGFGGEPLEAEDYEALRRLWQQAEERAQQAEERAQQAEERARAGETTAAESTAEEAPTPAR